MHRNRHVLAENQNTSVGISRTTCKGTIDDGILFQTISQEFYSLEQGRSKNNLTHHRNWTFKFFPKFWHVNFGEPFSCL